jgi:hypothetical protein
VNLSEAEKLVKVWREHLHDFWDWRDLVRSDNGQPWCNSHYARHLIMWAIPLALSGQQFSATEKKLSFAPLAGAPPRLPWFVPGGSGCLERLAADRFQFRVLSGKLDVKELRIRDQIYRPHEILKPGDSVTIE